MPALALAQTIGAAVLVSEVGAAELALGLLVGAGFLLYPVIGLVSRGVAHRHGPSPRA
jgi:hypothetical protein